MKTEGTRGRPVATTASGPEQKTEAANPAAAAAGSSKKRPATAEALSERPPKQAKDSPQVLRTTKDALDRMKHNLQAKALVVGYSPTGGGHTARTLNIVDHALKRGSLPPGSAVILNVPEKWKGSVDRPGQLKTLTQALNENGVSVIAAQADKSVQGYLVESGPDKGVSDDARIINRFAEMPLRDKAGKTQVTDLPLVDEHTNFNDLGAHAISAKNLMSSLAEQLGPSNMQSRVHVLTDMDTALQKASFQAGVPGERRVDQQNHAVLLDLGQTDAAVNTVKENALLAKVLRGAGERVSHIGLGDKNPLFAVSELAQGLGIDDDTSAKAAREKAAAKLLELGKPVDPDADKPHGVLAGKRVKGSAANVDNVVCVYAHDFQKGIAKHLDDQVKAGQHPNTLFLFAGNALNRAADGQSFNGMHLAFLAEADMMTTSGAGTHGEFAYLHKKGGSESKLLALPIHGHNEQVVNADLMANDPQIGRDVSVRGKDDDLGGKVTAFMAEASGQAASKYRDGRTCGRMLGALRSEDTAVSQAHDLLFGQAQPSTLAGKIGDIEQQMRDSPLLKANRKFYKLVFQALNQAASSGSSAAPITVKLSQKDATALEFKSLRDVADLVGNPAQLARKLGSEQPLGEQNVVLLQDVKALLDRLVAQGEVSAQGKNQIAELKRKFGEEFVTGF